MAEKQVALTSRRLRRGDQETKEFTHGVIYGDYGIGKTYLAGTADLVPSMKNVLYASAEKGEDGLPQAAKDITLFDVPDYRTFGRLYDFLVAHHQLRARQDITGLIQLEARFFQEPVDSIESPTLYNTLIVDSLTEIQKYCLYMLLGMQIGGRLDDIPEYMQQRQWGQALEMILLMVRNFRALPMHKIFIMQQTEDTDEYKRRYFRPALQGQAKSSILGFFDYVGYYEMSIKDGKPIRELHLMPVGPYKAKHRFELFPGHTLTNPTMQKIMDARAGKFL